MAMREKKLTSIGHPSAHIVAASCFHHRLPASADQASSSNRCDPPGNMTQRCTRALQYAWAHLQN